MVETRSLRQRKEPAEVGGLASSPGKKTGKKGESKKLAEDDLLSSAWIDVARVITFLLVASCALSYTISGGESMFWGMKNKPKYMRMAWWKAHFQGPLLLTPEELATYDGSDPSKPIYLALNGTIYDVSANARTYGPGGSYHWFAGCDASRAYVTGCFADDRTPDMRGVEQMFLPLDDPEVDAHWSKEELNKMRSEEFREAKKKVHEALKHWVDFFDKSDKYPTVGKVKREEGWLKKEPRKELCSVAQKGRVKRKIPGDEKDKMEKKT